MSLPTPSVSNGTTKSQIQILRATPQDIYQIAALENKVFYDEPFSTVAFGLNRGSAENISHRANQIGGPGWLGVTKMLLKAVDEQGEIVGAAEWRFINQEEKTRGEEEAKEQVQFKVEKLKTDEREIETPVVDNSWGFGANVKFCEDAFVVADGHMDRACQGQDYAKLVILIVSPSRQRQGIGSKLIEAGLHLVDEVGMQCVLGASKEGRGLYKRYGFVDYEVMKIRLWEYVGGEGMGMDENCVMWRPGRKVEERKVEERKV